MKSIREWLISHLNELVPLETSSCHIGSISLSMRYIKKEGSFSPFLISLHSDRNNELEEGLSVHFGIKGDKQIPISVKRVQKTPIYVSCVNVDETNIYIIDFYEWQPVKVLYRIFYLSQPKENCFISIKISDKLSKKSDTEFSSAHHHFKSNFVVTNDKQNKNIFLSSVKNIPETDKVFIIAMSKDSLKDIDLKLDKVLARLDKISLQSRNNHILNHLSVQDVYFNKVVDELWFLQEFIHPDLTFDASITDRVGIDLFLMQCIAGLYQMIGRDDEYEAIRKCINGIDFNPADHILDERISEIAGRILKNLEEENPSGVKIQEWWDIISLPLFREKFKKIVSNSPGLLFQIYLLALRNIQPLHDEMSRRCADFEPWPFLQLMLFINKQIHFTYKYDSDIACLYPGIPVWKNRKILMRGKTSYQYTRYGQKIYTSVVLEKKILLRIDKEVKVTHNASFQDIRIKPAIPSETGNAEDENRYTVIHIGVRKYNIPLVWNKTELQLDGIRIRWIYKKDRFQFTILRLKNSAHESIKFNDEIIVFDRLNKHKAYIDIKTARATSSINLFDMSGRSYFLSLPPGKKNIILSGSMRNKYGIFVEKFNVFIKNKQYLYTASESGRINTQTIFYTNSGQIKLKIKNFEAIIDAKQLNESNLCRLLNHSPDIGRGQLVVVLGKSVEGKREKIIQFIENNLGYQPFIINESEVRVKLNLPYLIYIAEIDKTYMIKQDSKLSILPFLAIDFGQYRKDIFTKPDDLFTIN